MFRSALVLGALAAVSVAQTAQQGGGRQAGGQGLQQGGQAAQQGGRQAGGQGFQQGGQAAQQGGRQAGGQGFQQGGHTRPTFNPNQFCTPACTAPLQCQYSGGSTCKPGSHDGCFSCQAPRTRPQTRTGTRPPRTDRPGMRSCAKFGRGAPEDEATCSKWQTCSNFRGNASFLPSAGDDDAQCCCDIAGGGRPGGGGGGGGAAKQFCCEIPDAPTPSPSKCSAKDTITCSTPFFSAMACAKKIPGGSTANCDPNAPKGSAANKACFEYYDCVKQAYGKDFKQCCNCIDFYASQFDKDLSIDCEDPLDDDDDMATTVHP